LKTRQCLLVVVPHREPRSSLRKWSGRLFAAGFNGAWSFPWLAPLALLSLPFDTAELKSLALTLRGQSLAENSEGKFKTGAAAESRFPDGAAGDGVPAGRFVFGPLLCPGLRGMPFPESASEKILYRFSPVVLGSALLEGSGSPDFPPGDTPPPPELSFRAAAVANMNFRPLRGGNYSCEWEIGKLCWLPAVRRQRNSPGEADSAAGPESRSGHEGAF
jgi:hypothetical protein